MIEPRHRAPTHRPDPGARGECCGLSRVLGNAIATRTILEAKGNTREKEQSIKVYQIVRRGSKWHVLMPHASPGVHPSEDKSRIVAWTCEVAKKQDGTVQVRDIGGRIEMIYTYINGVEHHDDRSRTLGR